MMKEFLKEILTIIILIVLLCVSSFLLGDAATSETIVQGNTTWKSMAKFGEEARVASSDVYNKYFTSQLLPSKDIQQTIIAPLWYNRLYKNMLDQGPAIAAKASLIMAAWYFLWFRTNRGTRPENQPMLSKMIRLESFDEEEALSIFYSINQEPPIYSGIEYLMRDAFGSYFHCDSLGNMEDRFPSDHHYAGKNQLGLLGRIEKRWIEFNHNWLPIVAPATILLLYMYWKDIRDVATYTENKLYAMHNYMLGTHAEVTVMF